MLRKREGEIRSMDEEEEETHITLVLILFIILADFHHISTIGLLACSGVLSETGNVPPSNLSLLSGYAQSKWVAEQIVLRAHSSRRVRVRGVYRPGTLASDSQTGKERGK